MMKHYYFILLALADLPLMLSAQQNVGIGAAATRARLEVSAAGGAGATSAIFGSEGLGISFQQNWPGVGFNQYRDVPTGYGKYMGQGYAAVQYLDPANGAFALDMHSLAGLKDNQVASEYHRAFSIFNNGTVSFGKGYNNSNLVVDYLNINGTNTANGSINFVGTQYPSFINIAGSPGAMVTQIGPGKDGGTTYINDIPGNNIVIGGNATKVGINTNPLYLTTLSIRHAQAGGGLALIEQNSFNNWEWYLSDDIPCWMGQKYNGLLIGDYNPNTGVHGYVSDRRLKTNIRPLPPVLDKLMALQVVEYRMKTQKEDARPTQGFIAQELKKLFPELVFVVSGNDPGSKALPELHMVNYSQLFVLALKAIQEQQAEIAELVKEIEQIEKSRK
jgi:hypothetical protein